MTISTDGGLYAARGGNWGCDWGCCPLFADQRNTDVSNSLHGHGLAPLYACEMFSKILRAHH